MSNDIPDTYTWRKRVKISQLQDYRNHKIPDRQTSSWTFEFDTRLSPTAVTQYLKHNEKPDSSYVHSCSS